jgi:poly-beta-hydroxyalkanoate depolymerase
MQTAGCLVNKKTEALVVPESEGDFGLDDRIAFVLSEELFLSVR